MSLGKNCIGCFNYFRTESRAKKYCSKECIDLVKWELQEARLLDTGATDEELEWHRRRHPKYRIRRKLMGEAAIEVAEYTRTMAELRGERKRAGRIEPIDLDELIRRDKGKCYLCGKKVAKREKFGKSRGKGTDRKLYPTVDHVVPLSRGGEHTWDNVKLAHLSCNASKGGRITLT